MRAPKLPSAGPWPQQRLLLPCHRRAVPVGRDENILDVRERGAAVEAGACDGECRHGRILRIGLRVREIDELVAAEVRVQNDVGKPADDGRANGRHTGDRRRIEHAVAHDAQPARAFRHEHVAVRQERHAPRMIEVLGDDRDVNAALLGREVPRAVAESRCLRAAAAGRRRSRAAPQPAGGAAAGAAGACCARLGALDTQQDQPDERRGTKTRSRSERMALSSTAARFLPHKRLDHSRAASFTGCRGTLRAQGEMGENHEYDNSRGRGSRAPSFSPHGRHFGG